MNDSPERNAVLPGVERLLASLTGVYSAHVVAGPEGTLREIHVLATSELHPKQVVRNVESALSAGFGIEIDRRIVSVAQVRLDAASSNSDVIAPPPGDGAATPAPGVKAASGATATSGATPAFGATPAPGGTATPLAAAAATASVAARPSTATSDAPAGTPRVIYLGYDAHIDGSRRATCSVTLRAGSEEFTGNGRGHDTPRGRAEAAAQATFAALAECRGDERLGLEGVAIVSAHDREFVLVAARALDGRRPIPLTGVAHLDASPEEAAIFASLQATNRWRVST